nr:SGNH/GDSL hydrolase family protein [Methylobacterium sp. BTF04]
MAIAIGIGAVAFSAEDQGERNRLVAEAHLARRLPVIRAELDAAEPGFVLLAGNSHAEILGNALARRLPVVNGGIGGASARRYATQLDALPFRARAGVAMLFLGTNDILRTAAPLSKGTLGGFEAAVTRILAWLRTNADVVLVAAVPPIGPEAQRERDPAAVAAYTAVLRSVCERNGCRLFDPFAGLRDGETGLTTQALPQDGVHVRDYDAVARDLATLLRGIGVADRKRLPD